MALTFLEKSPERILSSIIGYWQSITGRVLYPSQTENLEMHTLAYREALLRSDIQRCAEQNLVEYARGEFLDAWGVNYKTPRLQPVSASCRVRFTLDAPSLSGRSFPAGTRITTEDDRLAFETLEACYVVSGQCVSGEVGAVCTTRGKIGNGLEPGVLCVPDPSINGVSVVNVSTTGGGGDLEEDTPYRVRLILAPASMGCGGSVKAYRYWALSASTLVADALPVNNPIGERGDILVYVLSTEGEPDSELLAKVSESCNNGDVRLIGDVVSAIPAIPLDYKINARVTVFENRDPDAVIDRVRALANEYARRQMAKLGSDVTPTQLLMAMSPAMEGLYQVDLVEPKEIIKVGDAEWSRAVDIHIELAGVARG